MSNAPNYKQRRQMPLVDHYRLLCRENHVRKPNSIVDKLFNDHSQKDAAFQLYCLRRRQVLADRKERMAAEEANPSAYASRRFSSVSGEEDQQEDVTGGDGDDDGETVGRKEEEEEEDVVPPPPRRVLTVQEEVDEVLGEMPPSPEEFQLTELVLDENYMGNHSLLVLVLLLKGSIHLSKVTKFSMRRAQIYTGDDRPTSVKGNHLIKLLCTVLFNHPSLKTIDLSGNEIATEAYLWLVELCKSATVLEKLILEDTLLQDHEKYHLNSVLVRNIKFHRKNNTAAASPPMMMMPSGGITSSATNSPIVETVVGASTSAGGPPVVQQQQAGDATSVRFWLKNDTTAPTPTAVTNSNSSVFPPTNSPPTIREKTYLEKYAKAHAPGQISVAGVGANGSAAASVITGITPGAVGGSNNNNNNNPSSNVSPAAAPGVEQSSAVWSTMEGSRIRQIDGVKTLTSQMSALLNQQHVRPYSKSPEERQYLVDMLRCSPLFKLLVPPSDLGPQLTTTAVHEAKTRLLSFEEKEVVRLQQIEDSRRLARAEDTLHFLTSLMLRATYQDKDIVIDEGDSSEWVFFVGPTTHSSSGGGPTGGSAAIVESTDGSVAFAEGSFFGEEEMLSTLDSSVGSLHGVHPAVPASSVGGGGMSGGAASGLGASTLGFSKPGGVGDMSLSEQSHPSISNFVGASAQQTGAAPPRRTSFHAVVPQPPPPGKPNHRSSTIVGGGGAAALVALDLPTPSQSMYHHPVTAVVPPPPTTLLDDGNKEGSGVISGGGVTSANLSSPQRGSVLLQNNPTVQSASVAPSYVTLYQLRREVFLTYFGRELITQRAMWRRFIEAVPAFIGLTPYSRIRLCDTMHKQKYVNGEPIAYSGREHITLVMDGVVTIKNVANRRVEPKTLARGEYFAFHPNMDDSPAQIMAHHAGQDLQGSQTTTGQPHLWVIPTDMVSRWYPVEVARHLTKMRKFWW